jgi:glycosyltransferase involved in cell wall biosynthesis
MTNRASEGAIEKKLNTEKVSTASPAVPEAGTALEESAASEISTTFHPEKVSIIISAFNAKDTIGEAIASALNGTHRNLEILVIDDGLTDGTENNVTDRAGKYQRIKYYKKPTNLGAYKSPNLIIEAATGQSIAFLDSDDTWEPNKLEECLKMLKQLNIGWTSV